MEGYRGLRELTGGWGSRLGNLNGDPLGGAARSVVTLGMVLQPIPAYLYSEQDSSLKEGTSDGSGLGHPVTSWLGVGRSHQTVLGAEAVTPIKERKVLLGRRSGCRAVQTQQTPLTPGDSAHMAL